MMKRTILCLIILLMGSLWFGMLSAETSLGTIGGLTRFQLDGDRPDKAAYRTITGGMVGGILEFSLTKSVTLSLQPSYIQKGTKIAFEVEGQKERVDSVDVKLDYFSVPVLVKVLTRGRRFYVLGGLEFGYLLDARYVTSTEDSHIKDELEKYDLAVQFGVGYFIPVGRSRIFAEARYDQSILNVKSDEESHTDERFGLRLKNSGWIFCAGFLIGL
jgi:hypothetical protein